MTNVVIKSLGEQERRGTLERNTIISRRNMGGERVVDLAKEFRLTPQRVSAIVKTFKQNRERSAQFKGGGNREA